MEPQGAVDCSLPTGPRCSVSVDVRLCRFHTPLLHVEANFHDESFQFRVHLASTMQARHRQLRFDNVRFDMQVVSRLVTTSLDFELEVHEQSSTSPMILGHSDPYPTAQSTTYPYCALIQ